jgi:hypothetical protein
MLFLRAKNNHATKVTFTQNFGGMIILPAKITSLQFEWMLTICQLNSLTGEYLRPQDYVSLGIPAIIYDWILSWWAKKILMAGLFSDS